MSSPTSPPGSTSHPRLPPLHHDLPDSLPCFTCLSCSTKLAPTDELVSKSFSGREGRAYLINTLINVTLAKSEDRVLMTGRHTVCDVHCRGCGARVGWMYEKAQEQGQKYKEGKFILERERVVKENAWTLELEDKDEGE